MLSSLKYYLLSAVLALSITNIGLATRGQRSNLPDRLCNPLVFV
jgi:hypothetical protein